MNTNIKLEVGKTYEMRNGTHVRIDYRNGNRYWTKACMVVNNWLENGRHYYVRSPSPYDLVREVPVVDNSQAVMPQKAEGTITPASEEIGFVQLQDEGKKPTIPHADLHDEQVEMLRALLEGKALQRKHQGVWVDMPSARGAAMCVLQGSYEVRIKPKSVVWYMGITQPHKTVTPYCTDREDVLRFGSGAMHISKVLRLELDPDTLDVISARTETP